MALRFEDQINACGIDMGRNTEQVKVTYDLLKLFGDGSLLVSW